MKKNYNGHHTHYTMARKQKKKQPITTRVQPTDAKFKHSRVETARLIRRFHVLNKELAKCKSEPSPTSAKYEQEILAEMEAMGGLDWYQKASQLGQSKARGGDSSKWLIQTLNAHCKDVVDKTSKPLRVLDIGAVAPDNYKPYSSWITAKPIDLNPQHPDIQKQDFLQMAPPTSDDTKFDIVCLSLVINFVGDPKDRGTYAIHFIYILLINSFYYKRSNADTYPSIPYVTHHHKSSALSLLSHSFTLCG